MAETELSRRSRSGAVRASPALSAGVRELGRRVRLGTFRDESTTAWHLQVLIARAGAAVIRIDALLPVVVDTLNKHLASAPVPRDWLGTALALTRSWWLETSLRGAPTRELQAARGRIANLIEEVATREGLVHPRHPRGDACALSNRSPRPVRDEEWAAFRQFTAGFDSTQKTRAVARRVVRKLIWAAHRRAGISD